MFIEDARFVAGPDGSPIAVTARINGVEMSSIPLDPGNRHYAAIIATGTDITPVPDAERVAARRQVMRASVDAERDRRLAAGYPTEIDGSPATLQTRPADRANWQTAAIRYATEIAAGNGAIAGATIRDADNANHTLSFADAHAILMAMADHGVAILARSWTLKDQIAAAEDEAALDAIDIEAGWP
ncbi:DUF4376 domain-containing protein [Afifella pfennigii]|uniref:DUF4376 domain-containing protein n=1 Tax=Afifella pfennigii TaxID=209897 RepID=UPI00047CF633|nr:DUF4376 domain-containing protein [Afifella pfennigii]